MGKSERGVVAIGGEVPMLKNTPLSSSAAVKRFFSEPNIFCVDDDSGLSATGSVRYS